jgi:hypothetical protein
MIVWDKKTYAKELRKGYWDLEPHFHYYSQLELLGLFETFIENKMNMEDINSALYGKFVSEGKPIKKGFYDNFNLISNLLKEIKKEVAKC